MCGVTDLDDACERRTPARLGVAPEELEVDDGIWWCSFDELLEDGCPFDLLHTRHLVHAFQDFLLVNGVTPALLLSTGDLQM